MAKAWIQGTCVSFSSADLQTSLSRRTLCLLVSFCLVSRDYHVPDPIANMSDFPAPVPATTITSWPSRIFKATLTCHWRGMHPNSLSVATVSCSTEIFFLTRGQGADEGSKATGRGIFRHRGVLNIGSCEAWVWRVLDDAVGVLGGDESMYQNIVLNFLCISTTLWLQY
jgi:hypothetical protein